MKQLVSAGLAGALLAAMAAPAPAQGVAQPVFAAFRDVCLATGAEPAAVTLATDKAGWRNGETTAQPLPNFKVDAKVTKSTHVGEAELKLFAWHGANAKGISAEECEVEVSKAKFVDLQAAVAASLGFSAQQSSPTKAVFQFSGPLEAPQPLTNDKFDEAAANGGVKILTLSEQGPGAYIGLLRIQK